MIPFSANCAARYSRTAQFKKEGEEEKGILADTMIQNNLTSFHHNTVKTV